MNTQEVLNELSKAQDLTEGLYLMGTKAYHQLGDISSDIDDIFYVAQETENFYVGAWITGLGFFGVLFPKSTSRRLTQDEIEYYGKLHFAINSQPSFKLQDLK